MNIKAVCTKDVSHKRFSVTAHVTQDWIVDEAGNHEETTDDCVEVTHRPDAEDVWTCTICGADAKVVNI